MIIKLKQVSFLTLQTTIYVAILFVFNIPSQREFYKEYLRSNFVNRDHTPQNWTYFVAHPTCLTIYKIRLYSSIQSKVPSQSSKQSIPKHNENA